MKKLTAGKVLSLLAILLTIAGCAIYCVNAAGSYYHDFSYMTPLLAVICITAEVLILISASNHNGLPTDLLYPLSTVLLAVTAAVYLSARVESAGIILGSDLESGNAAAFDALMMAFAGIGCFLAAMLAAGIAGCVPAKEQ